PPHCSGSNVILSAYFIRTEHALFSVGQQPPLFLFPAFARLRREPSRFAGWCPPRRVTRLENSHCFRLSFFRKLLKILFNSSAVSRREFARIDVSDFRLVLLFRLR